MRNKRKVRQGRVVSTDMAKTVVVAVETSFKHPLYKKILSRTRKFKAHDEDRKCSVGDLVSIMETRPLSNTKRWRVVEIVEKTR